MKNFKKFLPIIIIVVMMLVMSNSIFSSINLKSSEVTNWETVEEIAQDMNYLDFVSKVNEGKINTVYIEFVEEEYAKEFFVIIDETLYSVSNPNNESFKRELLETGVNVEDKVKVFEAVGATPRKASDYSWLSSIILYIIIFGGMFMLLDNVQKGNSLGSLNNDTIYKQGDTPEKEKTNVKPKTFNDVGGLKELKKDLLCVVDFLKNSEKYKAVDAKLPKGCLLVGPPGTGKTLLAKVVANEAGVPFLYMNGSDFVEMYVGRGAARVRELFKEARKQSPCIVFIDEIDSLCGKRGRENGEHSEDRKTLTALLAEMDGFKDSTGIMVFGATNRVDDLDPAVLRPGRFTEIYNVPVPETNEERMEVINIYAKNKKFDETVDLKSFSREMIGRSPAEIEAVLNEAAIISVQKGLKFINKDCLEMAFYKRVMRGHMKDNKETHPRDLKTIAYHEAGHTLIGKLLGQEITKVTIIPSTSGAGGVTFIQPGDEKLYSKKKLEERVMGLYGGRVAEFLLFDENWEEVTTGASNDIEQATRLLHAMVDLYGMSDNGFVNMQMLKGHTTSEKSVDYVVAWAKEIQEKTVKLMKENRSDLDKLAEALLEHETLYEKEIDEILGIKHEEKVAEPNTSEEVKVVDNSTEIIENDDTKELESSTGIDNNTEIINDTNTSVDAENSDENLE